VKTALRQPCSSSQLLVERLKFDALVRSRTSVRLERRRLNQHQVLERARGRLCAGVYLMSNRTALHEDDRMVAVLACDSSRKGPLRPSRSKGGSSTRRRGEQQARRVAPNRASTTGPRSSENTWPPIVRKRVAPIRGENAWPPMGENERPTIGR
jgi:hypothetical protein